MLEGVGKIGGVMSLVGLMLIATFVVLRGMLVDPLLYYSSDRKRDVTPLLADISFICSTDIVLNEIYFSHACFKKILLAQ